MIKATRFVTHLTILFIIALNIQVAYCQFSGAPKFNARKEDVPLIRCQVCELLADNAYAQVKALKDTATPKKRFDELAVISAIENIATSWKDEGDWITALHLQASGSTLKVVDKGEPGECGEACKTIEKAAVDIVGEHDTDIAETLFLGRKKKSDFQKWLCNELSDACKKSAPSLSAKNHTPYPAFKPRGDQQNMDKMLNEMESQGMKGQMWSREELMKQYMGDGEGMEDMLGSMGGMPDMGDMAGQMGDVDLESLAGDIDGSKASPEEIQKAADEARDLWNKEFEEGKKEEL